MKFVQVFLKFVQVFLVGAVALTLQVVQAAPVYLRALGAEETRATQDGASWATAFTTVAAAVQAARTGDGVIHAAAGVYVVPEKVDLAASLTVVGGFSGIAGEAAEDRDLAQNETIFTGDVNGDDVYAHITLDTEKSAVSQQTIADAPVIAPLGGGVSDGSVRRRPTKAPTTSICRTRRKWPTTRPPALRSRTPRLRSASTASCSRAFPAAT